MQPYSGLLHYDLRFWGTVDGDFRLIVIINWSLMIINFVMDTGGHSQHKILRSDVQGKVIFFIRVCVFLIYCSFLLFLLNKVHTYPCILPF